MSKNIIIPVNLETALKSKQSLLEIIDEISEEAKQKGLIPEILESLLEDE